MRRMIEVSTFADDPNFGETFEAILPENRSVALAYVTRLLESGANFLVRHSDSELPPLTD